MMRKFLVCLSALALTFMVGCVTINVYFPKAAAQKAADKFIGTVIGPEDATSAKQSDEPPATPDKPSQHPASQDHPPLTQRAINFLIPAAHAATPDLRIHTPAIDAIHERMRQRYNKTLHALLDQGVVGFTSDGLVAVRSASSVPLSQRTTINTTVADANHDRAALYREIAEANGHSDWESDIRDTFAKRWIQKAHSGWYYRIASGTWKQK